MLIVADRSTSAPYENRIGPAGDSPWAVLFCRMANRQMVWVMPTVVGMPMVAAAIGRDSKATRVDEDADQESDETVDAD